MVNEHNRISIPMIFLTETQLDEADTRWMHGVRCREEKFGIDLLEGKKPNMGWLGPEMSGEEGATFPEKLWWALDELAARSQVATPDDLKQYDMEVIVIDENRNCQLLLMGALTNDPNDCLPGHIWIDQHDLQAQLMRHLHPTALRAMWTDVCARDAELAGQTTIGARHAAMRAGFALGSSHV